jgi:hypothetical protein
MLTGVRNTAFFWNPQWLIAVTRFESRAREKKREENAGHAPAA